MKLIEHYVALVKIGCAAYGQMNEMTLTEVADCLFCTERNAKLILHKLENKNWIIRESGQGAAANPKSHFFASLRNCFFKLPRNIQWLESLKGKGAASAVSVRVSGASKRIWYVGF